MRAAILVGTTILAWNAVFVATAETGVLVPIAATATVLGGAAVALAGPAGRAAWGRDPVWGLAAGALLGVALAGASWLAWGIREWVPLDLEPQVAALYATLRRPPGPVLGFPLMVLTIVGEELIFRGLLQDALRARMGSVGAVLFGALLYTLANLGSGSWVLPLVALAMGLLWGALAELRRGLWLPLACHLVWDVVVFAVFPLIPA